MLGKTHIALGVASSLLITHPVTVPGIITSVCGGAVGGWIVDVDIRETDQEHDEIKKRESIFDFIIDFLFIAAIIVLDYLIGKGMCHYIVQNWGVRIWVSLFGLIILILLGLLSKHRTFTHSFLGMVLFDIAIFGFCEPVFIPFAIGYASHLIADIFNKTGMQLFFPLRKRFCLKLCHSDKKANRILFWISLFISVVVGGYLFAVALIQNSEGSKLIAQLRSAKLFGLSALTIYLIFINIVTFLGFQRSWKHAFRDNWDILSETDDSIRIKNEFETWVLNFMVLIGGGVGMLLSFLIHLAYPSGYNSNWWSFCYSGIMVWSVIYLFVENPFGFEQTNIVWLSLKHVELLLYLVGINLISALYFLLIGKKRFDQYDIKHTILILLGMAGGTAGAIIAIFASHQVGDKFHYVTFGFPIMMISQILLIIYLMSAAFV